MTDQSMPTIVRRFSAIVFALVAIVINTTAKAQGPASTSPVYSSPELDSLIAAAATVNARIPEQLRAYRAEIETEMSIAILDSADQEHTGQLEQIASDVRWRAVDRYDQRAIGYRSQSTGPMLSVMSIFGGWTTPTLYGNQLQLGVMPNTSIKLPRNTAVTGLTIHPLSADRARYYTFAGGDTSVVLYSRGRRIPVVHIRVTPNRTVQGNAILFLGDLFLDANRKQIVRMRGRMVEFRHGRQTLSSGRRIPGVSGASFIEIETVEVDGKYWLPAFQRTELHARFVLLGNSRAIVRIVSRFHDYRVNDSSWTARAEAPANVNHYLSFSPSDSLTRFNSWLRPLGAMTTDANHADFDDVAPKSWGTTGSATLRFQPRSVGDVLRFNRIEGVFTGFAAEEDLSNDAPGLSVRASGGWAWSERTARGRITVQQSRRRTTIGLRLERSLVNTNDFQLPLTGDATAPALLGSIDDFDYLDRRSATAFLSQQLGAQRRSLFRLEAGSASDNPVSQHISQGLFVQGEGFRPNRGIKAGHYFRTVASVEVNGQVSGMFLDRGIGGRIQYDRADGDVRWQRLELRTAARRELGPFQLFARGDAGALIGALAPQAMFEIGRGEGLTAYGYKEFGGDRAAIGHAVISYTFPILRAPLHLPYGFIAPGIAPGLAAGIHAAWAGASSDAARRALLDLGTRTDVGTGARVPLSRPSDGIRASAEVLLTFFSGAISVGVARPIDRRGPWKLTGRGGQGFGAD